MKWLILHGHQFDPDFQHPWQEWAVKELDRASSDVDWSVLNALRQEIQASHASTNNDLIIGARKLGYNTVCGHSHLHQDSPAREGLQRINFVNDGCWLSGPDGLHYVLFYKDKIAIISDLHVGSELSNLSAIMNFLTFAGLHGWKLYYCGDILDAWAHSVSDIAASCPATVDALATYPNFVWVPGNHDGLDIQAVRDVLRIPKLVPTNWYEFIETDDEPILIGWPNKN